jgi:hypothetical protein
MSQKVQKFFKQLKMQVLKSSDILTRMAISARHWWLTSVILATQEAEIRRIMVRSQQGQILLKTKSQKKKKKITSKSWWSGSRYRP